MSDLESILTQIEPPTVGDEKSQRQAHRDILAAWFQSHPLEEIAPADLEALVGRNYQQRISDCRLELKLRIENVPRWLERADGRKRKVSGSYRFLPYEPLGRDAGTYTKQPELF